jgi:hypothetical protein
MSFAGMMLADDGYGHGSSSGMGGGPDGLGGYMLHAEDDSEDSDEEDGDGSDVSDLDA